ncbi:MAG TPA: hypothetical protein VFS62_09180 [Chloroflexota bacterium]|nr:hypothetical protein [Chloroflexota bacterium]
MKRDPLVVSGAAVLVLFLLMLSVLGRMFVFLRVISVLLLLAVLVFAALLGARVYLRDERRS